MRHRTSVLFALLVGFLVTASTFLVWRWAINSWEEPVTAAGIVASAQLLLAALSLWIIGSVVMDRVLGWCAPNLRLKGSLATQIYRLIAGQIACQVWVLARGALSGLCFFVTRHQAPITALEVVALGAFVLFLFVQSLRHGVAQGSRGKQLLSFGLFLLLLVVAVVPLALRDLPRTGALSSDADQHAFWASQVLLLGGIPWDQGILGIGPFGYPAGFATLNAIWCLLSGLSPVEIVTIQPQLQFLLAILLISAITPRLLSGTHATTDADNNGPKLQTLLVGLAGCAAYWCILPYGLQEIYYLSAGTARCSTSLLASVVFMGWLAFPAYTLTGHGRALRLVIICTTAVIIATFNPITAIIPGILAGSVFLYESVGCITASMRRQESRQPILFFLALGATLCILLLGDPYFGEAVLELLQTRLGDATVGNTANVTQATGLSWSTPTESVVTWLSPPRIFALLFSGSLPPGTLTIAKALCIGAGILYWFVTTRGCALRYTALLLLSSLGFYTSLGFPSSGTVENPVYLVKPYLGQACLLYGALLGFILFTVLVHMVLGRLTIRRMIIASVMTAAIGSYYPQPAAATNAYFRMTPRASNCGVAGCVTQDDQAVLDFIRRFGEDLLSRYNNLTYQSAPKILILGNTAVAQVEKWVFPAGAGRVLPLISPLPVAFFYGRGSPAWSYDNYRHYVCLQFNKEWLRQRNVRYLFISSSNDGCLRGRERVLRDATILFQSGEALFAQLF